MTPQTVQCRSLCLNLHKVPPFIGSHTLLLFESSAVKTHEVVITAVSAFSQGFVHECNQPSQMPGAM